MQIVNPKYSFVKFDSPEAINTCCNGDQEFCIPVIEETDTYFQVKLTSTVYSEIQDMMDDDSEGAAEAFHLLLLAGSGNTPDNFVDNLLRDWTFQDHLTFEKFRTGLFEITLQWKSPFKDIKTLLDCGDCFQLAFIRAGEFSAEFSDEFSDEFDIDGTTIAYDFIAISNCFKRACEDCFTSVLEYYNDDDYAEFRYCNVVNGLNRVRLPFYLLQPKMTEDKAVYRKSNGVVKQTKSLLTKEYQVLTEFFPEWLHDKFTVALAHDNIYVVSGPYQGGISKSGEYVPDWSDNDCNAPASFKVLATPYAIRNNNCQDCQEVELCVPIVAPEFSLPDANVGEAYDFPVAITGFHPTLNILAKPAWMSIIVSGSSILFSGTPEAEESNVEVSFTLTNPCTPDLITISKTLNIDNMVPGMILMWSGDPTAVPSGWLLCDGSEGTPNLSGMFIVGYSAEDEDYNEIGKSGGEKAHTLTIPELATHSHGGIPKPIADTDRGTVNSSLFSLDDEGDTDDAGGDEPHENRPPFYTLAYIIKS